MHWLLLLTSLAGLDTGALGSPPSIAQETPATRAEWKALGEVLLQNWREKDLEATLAAEERHGAQLLALEPGLYLPTICMAGALYDKNRFRASLPYYEKALPLVQKEHNLLAYVFACYYLQETERAAVFLRGLERPGEVLAAFDTTLEFFVQLEAGDRAYLEGQLDEALRFYTSAREQYETFQPDPEQQATFERGQAALAEAYTYRKLYFRPGGYLERRFMPRTFLDVKLRLCAGLPRARRATTLEVAAAVVPATDLEYRAHGRTIHESLELDAEELALYQRTWRFATDALQLFSEGRLVIETEWIELEGTVLKGLREYADDAVVVRRHLDPARIEPRPVESFDRIVDDFDAVVFVWDRGAAAAAYGGGPIALPRKKGTFPLRGGVRSLPPTSSPLCIHELLHNVERRPGGMQPVHGPTKPWDDVRSDIEIRSETDWYEHLVRSFTNWKKARYVR